MKDKKLNLFNFSSSITRGFTLSLISAFKKENGVRHHFKHKRNFIKFICLSNRKREIGVYW